MFYTHNQARLKLPRQRRRICQQSNVTYSKPATNANQKSPMHKQYQSIVTNQQPTPLIPRDNEFKSNISKGKL